MLHELRVENLLLIERAELGLGPGLNVLTGETGAGKTVLAHALDLLLGGKPRPGIVRPGRVGGVRRGRVRAAGGAARRAGRPAARGRRRARARAARERRGPHARLRRRPQRHGGRPARSSAARCCPSTASTSTAGSRSPRRSSRSSTASAAPSRRRGARRSRPPTRASAALREELEELRARAGARDRELDLLEWELEEIDRAEPERGRGGSRCVAERERLRHLASAAAGPRPAAAPPRCGEDDGGADGRARGRRAGARGRPRRRRRRSTRWPTARRRWRVEADDLAGELRRYGEGDRGAARAGSTSSRSASALLDRLKRKHGGTIAAVLAHAEECRAPARRAGRRRGGAGGRRGGAGRGARRSWPSGPRRCGRRARRGRGRARRRGGRAAGRAGDGGRDASRRA